MADLAGGGATPGPVADPARSRTLTALDVEAEVPRPAPTEWLGELLLGLLMAGLSVSIYLGVLGSPFVYDDRVTVVENPTIRHLGDLRVVVLGNIFRPVVNLSFAIDHALWGLNPVGFHLTNLLLHAVNVVLVFLLVIRMVRDVAARPRGRWEIRPESARLVGLAVSALFAVHPMMTEAVGYVSGRSDVLMGTFFLLAVLAMRAGMVSGRPRWVVSAVGLFVLALACKEVAVMFPFVVLAYDRLILGPSEAYRRRRWRLHLPLVLFVIVLGAARVAVFLVVENTVAPQALARMAEYSALQMEVVWKYIRLLTLPLSQSIVHNVSGLLVVILLGAGALVAMLILAFRARDRAPLLTFGVAWFLLLLVPSSSVIPLQHLMAEHRVYLASLGFFLVAAMAFALVVQRLRGRPLVVRALPCALGIVVLAGFAASTVARNIVWTNPVALWRDAAIKAPRWDTYMAYGNALRDAGNCPAALGAYGIASRLSPERLLPLAARWSCLRMMGRDQEAGGIVWHFRLADPQLTRLCREARALAPNVVSIQSCIDEFRPFFGPDARP